MGAAEKQMRQALPALLIPADVAERVYRAWYTTVEAADYLRITRAALLKHVERGHLVPDNRNAAGRIAGHRFRRETLERFMGGD
ncbi:MAG: helix-turn-helix domain-containing protein [Actinobacteria bacterium]|nr:helix-turn-helix domain-containing protein [Actinomycetota bacterium]